MAVKEKHKVPSVLKLDTHVAIKVGCGVNKRHTDAIVTDMLDYSRVDVVCVVEFTVSHSSNLLSQL